MDESPGAKLSSSVSGAYGRALNVLCSFTNATVNKNPSGGSPAKPSRRAITPERFQDDPESYEKERRP